MMKFIYQAGDKPLEGYTIRGPIGHGGFGEVYHAVSDGGKEVALKLVQRNLEVELRGVGQCLNVKHHNLVTVFDVRETAEGETWIVMEHVEGKCLSAVLEAHPNGLTVQEALRWLDGIVDGVDHLHRSGVVHRDLKPSNIFDDRGTVKVGDYSLSKYITTSRRSGQTQSIGTVNYMAPEIGSGRYGREVDIYAIGVILYEMLTGDVPFTGETPTEILMKHLTAPPDLQKVPQPLRSVVGRMLSKNPDDRYSSLQAVRADIHARLAPNPQVVSEHDAAATAWPVSAPLSTYGTYPGAPPVSKGWKMAAILRERPALTSLAILFLLIAAGIPILLIKSPADRLPNEMGIFLAIWASFSFYLSMGCWILLHLWRMAYPTERMMTRQQSSKSILFRPARGLSVSLRESPLLWTVCITLTLALAAPLGGELLVQIGWLSIYDAPVVAWCALSAGIGICIFAWLILWRTACPPPSVRQARELHRLLLDAAMRDTRIDSPALKVAVPPPEPVAPPPTEKKEETPLGKRFIQFLHELRRSPDDYWVGGVCGGLGEHTPLPSWVWRVMCAMLFTAFGIGFFVYFLLWVCLPEEEQPAVAGKDRHRSFRSISSAWF